MAHSEISKICFKIIVPKNLVGESCYSMSFGGTSCKIDLLFLCLLFVLFLTTRPDKNIYSGDLNTKQTFKNQTFGIFIFFSLSPTPGD